jgi:nucleotide-binding universal stress UspA family protein
LLDTALANLPADLDGDTLVTKGSSAAQALHDLVEEERVDVLALGSSHRSPVGRVLAGSTGERLLHGVPCALAVAPRGYAKFAADRPVVIAVGFNGMPDSRRALVYAARLAEDAGATLRIFAVHEPEVFFGYTQLPASGMGDVLRAERETLERALATALEGLPKAVRPQGTVLEGAAPELLAAEAEKGVDLLVLGSRGYGPVLRVLAGGTTVKLMRSSPCPVLAVPRGAPQGEPTDVDPAETVAAG